MLHLNPSIGIFGRFSGKFKAVFPTPEILKQPQVEGAP
jgi:hypothetical protein